MDLLHISHGLNFEQFCSHMNGYDLIIRFLEGRNEHLRRMVGNWQVVARSQTDLDALLKLEPGFVGILFASWVRRWQYAGI